jgi:ATP-dependent Clp protease ATP-binding subunit ClpC
MQFISSQIFNKFTTRLKHALLYAGEVAKRLKSDEIRTDHLLYGIILEKNSIASKILQKSGVNLKDLEIKISLYKKILISDVKSENLGKALKYLDSETKNRKKISLQLSQNAKKIVISAVNLACKCKHGFVGTEHLLWTLVNFRETSKLLKNLGADITYIKKQIDVILKNTSKFSELAASFRLSKMAKKIGEENLKFFCKDLTSKKFQNKINPFVGRKKEIDRIINILGRKDKNNPLLLGEPGVGKTAVIEGLASKIFQKEVPTNLQSKRILSLDLAKIISGTMFRGEFEGRLKSLIEEIEQNPNNILFIDEIHTIIGLGSTTGSMDGASILKPVLASGNFQCIGSTTFDAYRKVIEGDPAFERRFRVVKIEEPKTLEAIEILRGVRKNYEDFHQIQIADEAIIAAVKLSERFIPEKFLPDKALDLIDETASYVRTNKKNDEQLQKIINLEKKVKLLDLEKQKNVSEGKYIEALILKEKENQINREIFYLRSKQQKLENKFWGKITAQNIAKTVSSITKIPLERLISSEKEKLLNLENILKKKIIGQDEICKTVARFIQRSRAGISSPNRPIGSFMFLGPTGVGKTELAKVIAREIFEDEKALIRFDMSEFAEKFNASKLIGAPAGYIGFEEGGKLTEEIRKKPYCVVLFDEIEKAHPDIFNLLLPVLDEGMLTDAKGVKINFKNTIIIMTSNTGTKSLLSNKEIGFGEKNVKLSERELIRKYEEYKGKILSDLKEEFRPEFLNRVDKILIFKPLDQKSILKIVDLQIEELKERLTEKRIKLNLTEKARQELASRGFNMERGARPLRSVVQELIEDPLALAIIREEIKEGNHLEILKTKEGLELKKTGK